MEEDCSSRHYISLSPNREASMEYDTNPAGHAGKVFRHANSTGMYTFSHVFIQDVLCIGHPAKA
jgi:hypothetical protein